MRYLDARMFEFLARFYVAIREREQECEASSSRKQITVMKALSTSSADNSNCFSARIPGVVRESCAEGGLLRLARLLSLLAFSVRRGAGVHAVALAPIVPGARGDRANDHQKKQ
jgi:hypothetical protein